MSIRSLGNKYDAMEAMFKLKLFQLFFYLILFNTQKKYIEIICDLTYTIIYQIICHISRMLLII